MPIFARLKPQDSRRGFPLLTCTYDNIRFEAGGPACQVTAAQAVFLRQYRENETNPESSLAFDVWTGSEGGPGVQAVPAPAPAAVVPRATPGLITTADIAPPKAARVPVPPSLEEVRAAGYTLPGVAESIVERETEKAAAGLRPYGDKEPPAEPPPVPVQAATEPEPDPTPEDPAVTAARDAAEATNRETMATRFPPRPGKHNRYGKR